MTTAKWQTFLDLMIDKLHFLQVYFVFARIFARFCKFQKLSQKETAKESAKRREPTLTKVSLF
jgi:hypothetical protein